MIRTLALRACALCASALCALGMASPTLAQEPAHLTYEMREGDTLIGIAQEYLVRAEDWPKVQQANDIRDPRTIPVGTSLKLPRTLLRSRSLALEVAEFSGPVTIGGTQVARGSVLRAGSRIATNAGGFVTLTSDFGGRISMPSNSEARLKKAVRYTLGNTLFFDFEMERGRGAVNSPTLKGQDQLLMSTPRAVTAVRGTEFRVAFDGEAERSLTEVTEGVVAVAAGADEIASEAGFGVASTADGLSEPEALLAKPDLINPTAKQVDENLTFRLNPAPGAVAHRVQLARDADFLDIIEGQIIEGDTAVFSGLEDARYYVRARAISASGLEGFSGSDSFRRLRVGAAGEGGRSDTLDGFLFRWRSEGKAQARFAFQLWEKGKRGQKIVDETGLSDTALVLTDLAPGAYEWRVAAIVPDPQAGLIKVWGADKPLNVGE